MRETSRSSGLAGRGNNEQDVHGGLVLHSDQRFIHQFLVDDDGPGTGTEYDPPRSTGTAGGRTAGPPAVLDELGGATAPLDGNRTT